MDDLPELDNPAWHALTSVQHDLGEHSGDGHASRFDRAVSPFGAVGTGEAAAWNSVLDLVGPGRAVVFIRTEPVEPSPEWTEVFNEEGSQYVCVAPPPLDDVVADGLEIVDLGVDDVEDMLALTELTKPGPFLARTHEMGHYIGVRSDGHLVAMAGQRLRSESFTEISAVCVHPDARRRGLAAALTTVLAHEIRAEGKTAILHVRDGNDAAHAVYQAIGFEQRCLITFSAFRHQGGANYGRRDV